MDQLLQLLEGNALLTPEKLGLMLGVSPEEVRQRIDAYEKSGVIRGYKAVINDDQLNLQRVKAVIEVRVTPEREGGFDRVAERIAKFDEVTSCFLMSGAYDILIFVEGRTLQEVAAFVASRLASLDRVLSTATHFILKTYKEQGIGMADAPREERMAVTP